MRSRLVGSFVLFVFLCICFAGCSSNAPEVAPRSADEIAEYKKQVYGAEAEQESEDSDAAEEDE